MSIKIPGDAPSWLRDFARSIQNERREIFTFPPRVPGFEVANLPDPAKYTQGLIYVSDETGGATMAFSDGTNWRRVQDRNVVS